MAEQDQVARIRAYLEQHRQTYDRDTLRNKLLSDGHDRQAVDLAVAQVYGFDVPPSPTPPQKLPASNLKFILAIVGIFLFNYLALPLIVGFLTQTLGDSLILLGVAALALEIVAGFALRRRDPQLARGIRWGLVATAVPLVGLALLFGACLAVLGSF